MHPSTRMYGIREESEHSVGKEDRARKRENGREWVGATSRKRRKRASATGSRHTAPRVRRELLQILNISDHQSPRARQYPKVLVLHLFLYRAPIYERGTFFPPLRPPPPVGPLMAIIVRSRNRYHLAIYIIFYSLCFRDWTISRGLHVNRLLIDSNFMGQYYF